MFGQEFASHLAEIEPGGWTGPVISGYGLHLVRVSERLPARMPEFADVRDKVEREWRFMRRQELDKQFFRSLKERYTIEVQLPDWLDPETESVEASHK